MKIVLQRVKNASVRVDGKIKGKIKKGFCLFVGIEKKDIEKDAEYLSKKIVELRIFPDETGKMNLSLSKVGGGVLVISQFTLAGSVRKGRRPSVRGVAMNPVDHPMGGGEGRSSGGRHPCSPWGKPTKGFRTRKNKTTDRYIVKRRTK